LISRLDEFIPYLFIYSSSIEKENTDLEFVCCGFEIGIPQVPAVFKFQDGHPKLTIYQLLLNYIMKMIIDHLQQLSFKK